jgi:cell division transport system permease protein
MAEWPTSRHDHGGAALAKEIRLVKVWLRDHVRASGDALRRLAQAPLASGLNVLVIGVALSLPVGVYLILAQLQTFTRQLTTDPQISIFMELDADGQQVRAIEDRLRTQANVRSYRFIPRARAFADLKRNAGLSDVLDNLKQNPLPDAFVATGMDSNPETLERLRDTAGKWPKVAHVQLDSEWARRLDAALRLGRTAIAIVGLLLSSALVAVTFNTIRLQILTRQEEIEIAKLIGATNPFIRRPFLYFGGLQGLAGGVMGWAVLTIALLLLNRDLSALAALYSGSFHIGTLSLGDALALLAFSAVLGWLGAWLSVTRHLWRLNAR